MPDTPRPGLLILHGNRLEQLAEAVLAWLGEHPLGPLDEEVFLVPSNGMAEWLKMEIAAAHGICAAARVQLPARFVWQAYRAVLGRQAVPPSSPLDALPLTWRLMALLPGLAPQPGFEPIAGFLADGDPLRRLQLAQRLADLFDQYQVYRADWLEQWAQAGLPSGPVLRDAVGRVGPVPEGQRWQPALWRAVLAMLDAGQRAAARTRVHQRFLDALRLPAAGKGHGATRAALPSRITLFGTTHMPHQTLEAVAALSAHVPVLMAVPNPCRYHWADIIDGAALLDIGHRRMPWRQGRDLSCVPMDRMHEHGHPLLAAWGRQSRDFVRQLDAFDDALQAQQRFELPRVDLFDEGPGRTLLQQVQARIRDLSPLGEHQGLRVDDDDRSIVFHVGHGAQREVETLHDQLLHLLAHPPGGLPLQPRDVVVMVPDIETFAPAIRAVFGQHPRGHARHIPWDIADQRDRGRHPLLVALEWLLRAPQQRFTASQWRDLLDVPALARRFGLQAADVALAAAWIDGAGVRWGLDAAQRESLGLPAGEGLNTWRFGLQRMLLGHAAGPLDGPGPGDIEPFTEVGGLSAAVAGGLAEMLEALQAWSADALQARPPRAWAQRLRSLLETLFLAEDDGERAALAALERGLSEWLQACEEGGFDEAVSLPVVREAWLQALELPGGSRRFKAAGVTFCTLMPLRAIPFEVVCLLGMNEGEFPRRQPRSDFDLMALEGQARPGDRSRADDDRQMMLDALLSARRVLHVSWSGRSPRDAQEQPPSVLVAQLRDYLRSGWGDEALAARTIEHPMQPFSRRYFEHAAPSGPAVPGALFTYALEWRAAHEPLPPAPAAAAAPGTAPPGPRLLGLDDLAGFLANPVKAFFRQRLRVSFPRDEPGASDDEPFVLRGLEAWTLRDELLAAVLSRRAREQAGERAGGGAAPPDAALPDGVRHEVLRLARAGRLPWGGPGQRAQSKLVDTVTPMLRQWERLCAAHPGEPQGLALRLVHPARDGLVLEDTLALRAAGPASACPVWLELLASGILERASTPRADKLLKAWVRSLAASACGVPAQGWVIATDAVACIDPPVAEEARALLLDLMVACDEGLRGAQPWPTAPLTGLAWLRDPDKARVAYEGDGHRHPGERREACLARLYPDHETLVSQHGFEAATQRLYGPLAGWLTAGVQLQPLPGAQGQDDEGGEGDDD